MTVMCRNSIENKFDKKYNLLLFTTLNFESNYRLDNCRVPKNQCGDLDLRRKEAVPLMLDKVSRKFQRNNLGTKLF